MTPKFHLTHPVLNPAGTVLQVTPRISANLSWTNVPRKNPQNLKFQVAPRIINVEYHTAGNHTQPLMSTKPSAMTKKTAFQQQKQLCFSSRVYAMSTSGFRDKNSQKILKIRYLWMKTCELKFPLGSGCMVWKKHAKIWMKTSDPSV